MKKIDLEIKSIEYPLCVEWSISRSSEVLKKNYYVLIDGVIYSEFAPNLRFGETHQSIEHQTKSLSSLSSRLSNEKGILNFCADERMQGRFAQSLLAGIELACFNFFDLWDKFISAPLPKSCSSSMSIPIIRFERFLDYFKLMRLNEFDVIKVKSGEKLPLHIIDHLINHTRAEISVDYNEALSDLSIAMEHINALKKYNRIKYIEQPFASYHDELYRELKKCSPLPIYIDETITGQMPSKETVKLCHGINFKVMKSGGPLRVIEQIKAARKLGLGCMLGCMIESSRSISNYVMMSELVDYCDLDGNLFLAEDPFKMITVNNGIIQL